MKKNIALFWPSDITGGVEFLILTAARILKDNAQVIIIDKENGWLKKNTTEFTVECVSNSQKMYLDSTYVVVTFGTVVRYLDDYLFGEFSIVSWGMHPNNMIPTLPNFKLKKNVENNILYTIFLKKIILHSEYKKNRSLALYMQKNNALYTMDGYCSHVMKNELSVVPNGYLPVVISDDKLYEGKRETSNNINIVEGVWLGRLDGEFKTEILKRVLLDLDIACLKMKMDLVFNIVGAGPALDEMILFCKKLTSVRVNFLMEKRGQELKDILSSATIGFAMGTSAIEIAACKTPCILVDYSYLPVDDEYRYKWFFDSTDYVLGRQIDMQKDRSLGNKLTMEDVLSAAMESWSYLSNKSFEYIINNHTESVLKHKLQSAIENTTANFKELQENGLFTRPFWNFLKQLRNLVGG